MILTVCSSSAEAIQSEQEILWLRLPSDQVLSLILSLVIALNANARTDESEADAFPFYAIISYIIFHFLTELSPDRLDVLHFFA